MGIIIQNTIVLHVNNFNVYISLMNALKKADFFVLAKLFMLYHQIFTAVFVLCLILFALNDL